MISKNYDSHVFFPVSVVLGFIVMGKTGCLCYSSVTFALCTKIFNKVQCEFIFYVLMWLKAALYLKFLINCFDILSV